MPKIISIDIRNEVKKLWDSHSTSEIAKLLGISQRTVFKIKKEWNLIRTPEQIHSINSRIRSNIILNERRRVIFNQPQKTNIKVVCNKKRLSVKYRLKRLGYIQADTPNCFLYNNETKRKSDYESLAKKLGIEIKQAI